MGKKYVRIQELEPERQKKSKIIAVMNNKGGCGKTSTAIALGMYLARTGNNILFWDGDPQCNLTQRLGIPDNTTKKTLEVLFRKPEDKIEITQMMKYPHLQRISKSPCIGKIGIMPGDHVSERAAMQLEERFLEYSRQTEREVGYGSTENYLQSIFEEKQKYFDYIILDTAPALQGNTLNILALKTTNEIIYPVDSLEAMTGLDEILAWMGSQVIHRQNKPNGLFAMIKYQEDTVDMRGTNSEIKNAVFRSMKKVFKDFVCNTGVKELKSLRLGHKAIPGFGGITQYTLLSEEIINKITKPTRKNLFEFIEENGSINSLQYEINNLAKMPVKHEPQRREPQFSPRQTDVDVVEESN
jgi:chromosome partitioning protein